MTYEAIFIMQAIGVISIGGFIGELHRSSMVGFSTPIPNMIANYLAGSFLSMLIAYACYYYTQNRPISLLI